MRWHSHLKNTPWNINVNNVRTFKGLMYSSKDTRSKIVRFGNKEGFIKRMFVNIYCFWFPAFVYLVTTPFCKECFTKTMKLYCECMCFLPSMWSYIILLFLYKEWPNYNCIKTAIKTRIIVVSCWFIYTTVPADFYFISPRNKIQFLAQ